MEFDVLSGGGILVALFGCLLLVIGHQHTSAAPPLAVLGWQRLMWGAWLLVGGAIIATGRPALASIVEQQLDPWLPAGVLAVVLAVGLILWISRRRAAWRQECARRDRCALFVPPDRDDP